MVPGSPTQRGSLPQVPACSLVGSQLPAVAALGNPGSYQFTVTVPDNAPAGELHLHCTYDGAWTPAVLAAVQ